MKPCSLLFASVALSLVFLQPVWPADSEYADSVLEKYQENNNFGDSDLIKIDIYVEKLKESGIAGLAENVPGTYVTDSLNGGACLSGCRAYTVIEISQEDGTNKSVSRVLTGLELAVLAGVGLDAFVLNQGGIALIGGQSMINEEFGGPDIRTVLNNIGYMGGSSYEDNESDRRAQGDILFLPTHIFAVGGVMMIETAAATQKAKESLANSAESAKSDNTRTSMVLGQLEAVGPDSVGGISSMRYQVANMQAPTQSAGGQEFVPTGASLWIDVEKYVAVKHRIEGFATVDGTSREFYIEVENADFRNPAGCGAMYEPYRRTMRMGGMLDEQEMAEMQEAAKQLEVFDSQMASLPADQREMMERMVGGQMDTLRGLANSGAFEYVEEIEEIFCNPDLKALFSMPDPTTPENILQDIQVALVTLGYEPGNTDGVHDTMTQVAISQFQAERGLNVTGEPSQSLLDVLMAEVADKSAG